MKDYNLFDKLIFIFNIIFILILGIILKCNTLSIIVATLGVISALLQSKGKVIGNVLGIIMSLLYSYLSYKNQYYGELILYILVLIPMYFITIYNWNKHLDKEDTVKVYKLNKKDVITIIFLSIISFFILYYFLKLLHTSNLISSVLSMLLNVIGMYLLSKRSKYSFLVYIINGIVFLSLWTYPLIKGDLSLIPMIIEGVLLILIDIKGLIEWNRKEK